MAGTFKFELVSPERIVLSEDADQVVVPGADGDFTVLAGHAPIISVIRPGVLDVERGGARRRIFVKSGFADVQPDRLTVLAARTFDLDDIDAAALAHELATAESELAAARSDEERRLSFAGVERLRALQSSGSRV